MNWEVGMRKGEKKEGENLSAWGMEHSVKRPRVPRDRGRANSECGMRNAEVLKVGNRRKRHWKAEGDLRRAQASRMRKAEIPAVEDRRQRACH